MSDFLIQASHPKSLVERDPQDGSVEEAMQTVFPLLTEDLILQWNYIPVQLSYKYDLSVLMDDLLDMLGALLERHSGNLKVSWTSSSFLAKWLLRWESGNLRIESSWEIVRGRVEPLLRDYNVIEIKLLDFVSEWKRPLEQIDIALTAAGYRPHELKGFETLKALVSRIARAGILYRDET